MNLYVHDYHDGKTDILSRREREATPGEALQYALRCDTCDGLGTYYNYAPPGIGEPMQCRDCVDGIPRWAIETFVNETWEGLGDVFSTDPDEVADFYKTEMLPPVAVDVLVALRDREETE